MVVGEETKRGAQWCDAFLLLLHSLHAILFLSLLLLMDVNIPVRGAEFTMEGVSFVLVIPPCPAGSNAGPGGHRMARPMKTASAAQLNAARDTTPGYRGGGHVMGNTAVKEWCRDDEYR